MLDVVPPNPSYPSDASSNRRRARAIRPTANVNPVQRTVLPGGNSPVALAWKLPARLRKPIREQLHKERQEKKAREAIVRFERRPLITRPVSEVSFPVSSSNVGAEHHTGDVYRAARPKVRVSLPPYLGNFTRLFTGPNQKKSPPLMNGTPVQPQRSVPVPSRRVEHMRPAAPARPIARRPQPIFQAPVSRRVESQAMPMTERDAPYAWRDTTPRRVAVEEYVDEELGLTAEIEPVEEVGQAIHMPKSRLALPFSVNFWPKGLFTSKKKVHNQPSVRVGRGVHKVMVANVAVMAIGFSLVMGLVWNLQSVGRAGAVRVLVEHKVKGAYAKLLSAQAAFATTDFETGQEQLSDAHNLLTEARGDVTNALSAARHVLQVLDVTNTVRSGDRLLRAGQHLTAAGGHIARGASAFFEVEVFASESEDKANVLPITLLQALGVAKEEFAIALPLLEEAQVALQGVESPFLPAELQQEVATLNTVLPRIISFLKGFLEQSDTFASLLGARQSRQYLLLFANHDELRPVGGFIGSIGLVNVDNGQVENIDVDTVYDPDGQLKEFIAPPDPLLSITSRWYMRDANWFVDYEMSAKKVAQFFEKEGGPTVDGVILLTPEVMKRLLEVTGPIIVPGYDVVLTAENFQEVTQDQVTYSYDRELNKPKQFLADVTPLILNRLFQGSGEDKKSSYGAVMHALSQAAHTKDLLLYFKDKDLQQRVREVGWSGQVPQDAQAFLYVNNANIGGHKSDQFIDQEIDYRIEVGTGGDAQAVVTIRRTHHGPEEAKDYQYPPGEDPSQKDNIIFQRVLVPKGSRLLESKGYTPSAEIPQLVTPDKDVTLIADPDLAQWQSSIMQDTSGTMIGSEAGQTFFGNWIVTKPGQTTVTLYRYALPVEFELPHLFAPARHFTTTILKQPGDKRTTVRTSLKLPAGLSIVHAVPQQGITYESNGDLVYRGALNADIVVGGVIKK